MLAELLTALSAATPSEDLVAWTYEPTGGPSLSTSSREPARLPGRSFRHSWMFYTLCAAAGAGAVRALLGARG